MSHFIRGELAVFVIIIISITIGGSGCLWIGQPDDSSYGTSGSSVPEPATAGGSLALPIVPAPPNGASNCC